MRPVKRKALYYAGRAALVGFFSFGLLLRCANPMAPTGGPRDTLPPRVVNMTPIFGQTNFDATRVFIEFDEYVTLKDQTREFFTSPFMKKKPSLLVKGRGIQITIYDTLAPNTTYSLNFGGSIQDNNENNPLNSFRYVFSTGSEIDSMVMSGYTEDAYKKDSVSKTFLLFYTADKDSIPDYDSVVFLSQPDVVARAETNGIFIAENLKPVDYRVYALKDNNDNQKYEPGYDDIGFLEGTYNPATMPGFNVWYDTMRMYVTAQPQLHFRMFRDEPFRRQVLAGQTRPQQHKVILHFGAHYPQIDTLEFQGIPGERIITEYLKPTRDSIAYWFDVPAEELPDTINANLVYIRHDSLNNLVPERRSLTLGWRAIETRQQQRDRERLERERELAIAEGREPLREPNPFKMTTDATSNLNPERNIGFVFDYPLAKIDSARILLVRTEEERRFRVRYTLEQDTANLRRWVLKAPWSPGQQYSLEIPERVFVDVAGQGNDSLNASFTVMDPEMYGTVSVNVIGQTPQSEYVLQLTDLTGAKVIEEKRHVRSGVHVFRFVDPGSVQLRVIDDRNGNGQWDGGNLVERRQPERSEVFLQENGEPEIVSKEGWDIEFTVDMNTLFEPETMEQLWERLMKAEEVRIRKYLEDKANQDPKERERQERQNNPFGGNGAFPGFGGGFGTSGFQGGMQRF